jgi:hypothetical protein
MVFESGRNCVQSAYRLLVSSLWNTSREGPLLESGGSPVGQRAMPMQCVECGGPLVSVLERSRKVCASCFLHGPPPAGQQLPRGPVDRPERAAGEAEGRRSEGADWEGAASSRRGLRYRGFPQRERAGDTGTFSAKPGTCVDPLPDVFRLSYNYFPGRGGHARRRDRPDGPGGGVARGQSDSPG